MIENGWKDYLIQNSIFLDITKYLFRPIIWFIPTLSSCRWNEEKIGWLVLQHCNATATFKCVGITQKRDLPSADLSNQPPPVSLPFFKAFFSIVSPISCHLLFGPACKQEAGEQHTCMECDITFYSILFYAITPVVLYTSFHKPVTHSKSSSSFLWVWMWKPAFWSFKMLLLIGSHDTWHKYFLSTYSLINGQRENRKIQEHYLLCLCECKMSFLIYSKLPNWLDIQYNHFLFICFVAAIVIKKLSAAHYKYSVWLNKSTNISSWNATHRGFQTFKTT